MARSRNIKPGFFQNDELVDIDFAGRLLYIGLWCLADREGRLEDRPKKIKIELFPCDLVDVDKLLNQLFQHGFIVRYQVSDRNYIEIPKFKIHQNPHPKEPASVIPPAKKEIAKLHGEQFNYIASNADSLLLIPDSLLSDGVRLPPPDTTEIEREILNELKAIKGYEFDYQTELDFIRKLAIDYPKIDILFQVKKWCAGKIDKPLGKKSRPHSQLVNWCNNADGWQKEKVVQRGKVNGLSSNQPKGKADTNKTDYSEYDNV
jgi:hypothetical protein